MIFNPVQAFSFLIRQQANKGRGIAAEDVVLSFLRANGLSARN